MTVKEIVSEYLKNNGYEGLYDPGNCGCLCNDLMPYDNPCMCEPGIKKDCKKCKEEMGIIEEDDCPEFDFCIEKKPSNG